MDFIISILLLVSALWLVWFLGGIVFSTVRAIATGDLGSIGRERRPEKKYRKDSDKRGKSHLNKKTLSKVKHAEKLLEGGDYKKALCELKGCLILDQKSVPTDK